MKFTILNEIKQKEPDYTEYYKNMFKIYSTQSPKNFVTDVMCLLNEIVNQVIYKLWKVKQVTNIKLPTEITQIVDSFHIIWKEDTSLYVSKSTANKSQGKRDSQALVDFFLGKLKKAAEKTYLELMKQQKDEKILMKGINDFDSVRNSLSNFKFDISVSYKLYHLLFVVY